MLELVIGDITDINVRIAAFNGIYNSVSELLILLGNYTIHTKGKSAEINNFKRRYPFELGRESKKCFKCNQPGHIAKSCLDTVSNNRASETNFSNLKNQIICAFCKKVGHKIDDCFRKKRQNFF